MPRQTPSPASENSEETRAFLQIRLALFWKVLFFFNLAGGVLGLAGGGMVKPGPDTVITFGGVVLSGVLWWLCRRGKRSIRFCRIVDGAGLLVVAIVGTFLTRYILVGFVREHSVVTEEGSLMADGYVVMIDLFPAAMYLAIRAALIPSSPRRTIIVTGMAGVPKILLSSFLVPAVGGGLTWRGANSGAFPWLPTTSIMEWTIAIITCTVISRVIYGLRAEVREARRLGQYTLEKKIGEGGMGVVYRASHAMLRRPTAIKLLLPDRAGAGALARFEREVQRTAMLTHPNTVTVFDYGRTSDGVFYYAMELLEGTSLDEIVEIDGPQPEERVIHLLEQVAASLAEAHDAGLIHRDVKPGNILVVDRGGISDLVKVVDFGLVKDVGLKSSGGATSELQSRDAHGPTATVAGTITGTPLYIAPETITASETVDARADLYALGAVGYWLLTGTHVFGGRSVLEVCAHHLHSVPEPPSLRLGAPVSADLEAVLLACLAKRREDRPASAHVLGERLRGCVAAHRWTNARAAQWWAEHRHQLRSGGAGASDAHGARASDEGSGVASAPHLTVTRVA